MYLFVIRNDTDGLPGATQCEQIGFDGTGAIQAPGEIGHGLQEMCFGFVFRLIFVEEFLAMLPVGGEIVRWQDDGLAR